MRRVEVTEATAALSDYVRQVRRHPVVVTRRGTPVAAVVPMTAQEWEDYVVTHHRPLVESTRRAMERAKDDGGIALEDILAKYAHELKPNPRRTQRPAMRRARRSHAK